MRNFSRIEKLGQSSINRINLSRKKSAVEAKNSGQTPLPTSGVLLMEQLGYFIEWLVIGEWPSGKVGKR